MRLPFFVVVVAIVVVIVVVDFVSFVLITLHLFAVSECTYIYEAPKGFR